MLEVAARSANIFVDQLYIPDVIAVAEFYRDWFERGEGTGNFLSYGAYPQAGSKNLSLYTLPLAACFRWASDQLSGFTVSQTIRKRIEPTADRVHLG